MNRTECKLLPRKDDTRQVRASRPRQGFTLLQLLLVVGVIGILSAVLLGAFGNSRAAAHRATCDMNLKAITMALDAFRQERGAYPEQLNELVAKAYLTDNAILRCPADVRPDGSYNDYYVMRANRDSGELPILVCPLCVTRSDTGNQAFKGRYTKQFATRPATITSVSGATIESPGKDPIAARAGMTLRGGDIIRTSNGGSASLLFADGSISDLHGNSEITLLQSFLAGHAHAPLYTLIRQQAGNVAYRVHHGSKFDVTTPTATAGALGTAFEINEDSEGTWWLKVTESKVLVSDFYGSEVVANNAAELKSAPKGVPSIVSAGWQYVGESQEVVDPKTGKKVKKKKDKKDKGKGNNGKNSGDDDD